MTTTGDRDQTSELHAIGGQGVFTKEVQQAVLDGRADVAVHSAKDLPTATPAGLVLATVPERADPRDALVGSRLTISVAGARVGTGSVRRRAQLAAAASRSVVRPAAREHRDAPAQARRARLRRGRRRVRGARAARARGTTRPRCSIPPVDAAAGRGRARSRPSAASTTTRDPRTAARDRRSGRAPRGRCRARVPRRARRRLRPAVRRARARRRTRRRDRPRGRARVARRSRPPAHAGRRRRARPTSVSPARAICSTPRAAAHSWTTWHDGVPGRRRPGRSRPVDARGARSCCARPMSSCTTGSRRRALLELAPARRRADRRGQGAGRRGR